MEPQTPVAPAPVTDFVPQQWPGAFGIFNAARQAFSINWVSIVGVLVALLGASIVLSLFSGGADSNGNLENPGMYVLSQILSFLVSTLLGGMLTVLLLKSAQGVKDSFGAALSVAGSKFLPYLAQSFIFTVITIVSFLAFVIPFFIVVPRLTLAQYFLFDKDMGPIESLKASWAATKGHVGKVWGLIGLGLLCALTAILVITIPLTVYLMMVISVATAILYFWLVRYGATPVAPAAPAAPVAPTPPSA